MSGLKEQLLFPSNKKTLQKFPGGTSAAHFQASFCILKQLKELIHMNELEATLILTHAPFFGDVKIRKGIDYFGSSLSTLEAILNNIPLPFQLRKESADFLNSFENKKSWQEDLQIAKDENVTIIPYTSAQFPEKLKHYPDCPVILYVQGKIPLFTHPWIAIVGTRAATPSAMEETRRFAETMAMFGCVIVSGLARGIDTSAHCASLIPENGKTVAVIGSGLSRIYPKENIQLSRSITKNGALFSEYPMLQDPTRYTFPKRNRIISALSDAILLTEAPIKSGAMITMEIGSAQKKQLFALPGRAGGVTSAGNNSLIKEGIARLVDHPEEILKTLNFFPNVEKKEPFPPFSMQSFSKDEQIILEHLLRSELSLEELVGAVSLPISSLQATLIKLILKKLVLELPGKRYKLISNKT